MAEPLNYKLYTGDFRSFIPAGSLSGFCLLMTRDAYEAVGDYDAETFGIGGFETNDLMLRAIEKGYLAAVATKVFIYHLGGITINRVAPQAYAGLANRERFMTKWYRPREQKCCAAYRVKIDTRLDSELFLESLARMKDLVDCVVILDAESTVNIQELLKDTEFNGKVRQYMKNPKGTKPNEARDRNVLLKMARNTGCDWIWVADLDEWPDEKLTYEGLQRLMNPRNPLIKYYTAPIFVLWKSRKYIRVDGNWSRMNREVLFRNIPVGNIHTAEGQISCRRVPTLMPADGAYHTGAIFLKNYEYANPIERASESRRLISDDDASAEEELPVGLTPYVAPTFTYLMMARNESGDLLRHVFDHYCWADEFRIIDTGSIDDTEEICTTFDIPFSSWTCCDDAENPQHMLCHFGNARNFSIEQCSTDYVLFMDPDEKLNQIGVAIIPRMLTEQRDGYAIEIHNYRRVAGGDVKIQQTMQPRLFRNREEIRYEPDIHETLEQAFHDHPDLSFEKAEGPLIEHEGFLKHSENSPQRKWKNEEYMRRLFDVLEKDPNDARAMYSLSQHLISVGEVDDGDALLGKAVAASPHFFHARFALANRLVRRAHQLLRATPKGSIQYKEKKIIVERMLHDLGQWCDVGA
jgi:glycosyltransferase involved in cell wall biosynthesis